VSRSNIKAVTQQVSAHGSIAHTGDIDAIVAGLDGYVWVGYHKGRLERYTAGGMLAWWKVRDPGFAVQLTLGVQHIFICSQKAVVLCKVGAFAQALIKAMVHRPCLSGPCKDTYLAIVPVHTHHRRLPAPDERDVLLGMLRV